MSCSVASNVPGHEEATCFVSTGSASSLVRDMVAYLHAISDKAYSSLLEKYHPVFQQLDQLISREEPERHQDKRGCVHPAEKVKVELDDFIRELPVLGFNSGKYDINVVKRYLYSELQTTLRHRLNLNSG